MTTWIDPENSKVLIAGNLEYCKILNEQKKKIKSIKNLCKSFAKVFDLFILSGVDIEPYFKKVFNTKNLNYHQESNFQYINNQLSNEEAKTQINKVESKKYNIPLLDVNHLFSSSQIEEFTLGR